MVGVKNITEKDHLSRYQNLWALLYKSYELYSYQHTIPTYHTNIPYRPLCKLSISWSEIMSNISTEPDVWYILYYCSVYCILQLDHIKKLQIIYLAKLRMMTGQACLARLGLSTHQIFLHLLVLLGPHQAVHLLLLLGLLGLHLTLLAWPSPHCSSLWGLKINISTCFRIEKICSTICHQYIFSLISLLK